MMTLWNAFLTQQGAIFNSDNQTIAHFGAPEIERHVMRHGAVMTSLAHTGLIRFSGDDAKTFLQSQLTQDVNLITTAQAQLAAYCDPQGHVLGLGVLFLYKDAYYWQVARDTLPALLKRFKMFILRSKVDCEDFSDLLPRFGYAGIHAAQDIVVLLNEKLPETAYAQHSIEQEGLSDIILIRLPTAHPCALCIGTLPNIAYLWDKLETNGTPVGRSDWDLMDLAFGLPQVTAANAGTTTAHLFNLERLGAINFKKGCYPGQEIIARMQYRGKPTKRMMRFHTLAPIAPEVGSELSVSYGDNRSQSLTVVRSGADLNEGTLLLAIASIKGVEDAQGEFFMADGSSWLLEPMGYALAD
jgi:folate-binding protein YgfZ